MRRVKARSVKVKWVTDLSPTVDELRNTFQAWGPISTIKVKEKTALILYREVASVATALENYRGAWSVRGTAENSSSRSSTPNPTPTRLDRSQRLQDEYDRAEERRQRGRTRERGAIRGSSTQTSAGHDRDYWRQSAGDQATSRATLQQPSTFFDEAATAVSGGPVRAVRIPTMISAGRSAPFVARPAEPFGSSKVETQHGAKDADVIRDSDSTHEASYVVVEAPRHEKHSDLEVLPSSIPRFASKSSGGTQDIAIPLAERDLGVGKPETPGPEREDDPAQPEPPLRLEIKEDTHALKPPSFSALHEESANFVSVAPPKSDVVYFQSQISLEAPLSAQPGAPGAFPVNSSGLIGLTKEEAPRCGEIEEAALSGFVNESHECVRNDLPVPLTGFDDAHAKTIGQPASPDAFFDTATPVLMVNDDVPAPTILSTEAGHNCTAFSGKNDGEVCQADITLAPAARSNDASYGAFSKSPATAASTLSPVLPATGKNVDGREPAAPSKDSSSEYASQPAVSTQNLILAPPTDPPASGQSPPDSFAVSKTEDGSAVNYAGVFAYSASNVTLHRGPQYDSVFAPPAPAHFDPPLPATSSRHEANTSMTAFDVCQPGASCDKHPTSGEFAPESSQDRDTSQLFQDADSHSAFDFKSAIPSSHVGPGTTSSTQFEAPTDAPELAAVEHGHTHMSDESPHAADSVPYAMMLEDGPDPMAFTNAPSASSVPKAGDDTIGESCLPSASILQDAHLPSSDDFPSAPTYLAPPTDTLPTHKFYSATRGQSADLPQAMVEADKPETEFDRPFPTLAPQTDSRPSSFPQDGCQQFSEAGPPSTVDSPYLSPLPSNLFTDLPRATSNLHGDNSVSSVQGGSTARRRDAESASSIFGDVQAEMMVQNGLAYAGFATQSRTSNSAHDTSHFPRNIGALPAPDSQGLCGSQNAELPAFSPAQFDGRETDLSRSQSETKSGQNENFANASPPTECASETIASSIHHDVSGQLFTEAGAPSVFDQPPLASSMNEVFDVPKPPQFHPPADRLLSRGHFSSGNYGVVAEQAQTEFEFETGHPDATGACQDVRGLPSQNLVESQSKASYFDKAPHMHTPYGNDQPVAGPVVSERNHPPLEQIFPAPFPPVHTVNLPPSDQESTPASNGFSKNRPPILRPSVSSQSPQNSQMHLSTAFGSGSLPNKHFPEISPRMGSPTAIPKAPDSLAADARKGCSRPPHACIAFGFGGRVAAVRRVDVPFFSTTSTYQQQHVLEHQVVISRLPGNADLLVKPNALLSTDASQVDGPAECAAPFPCLSSLLAFIAAAKRRGDGQMHGVRDFVEAAFKHSEYRRNASVVNRTANDGVEEAHVVFWAQMRRLLDLKDKDSACAFLQDAHVNTSGVDDEAFPLSATRTRTSSNEALNAKKVENLLRDGDVQGAVSEAVKNELWPVAMILSSMLDDAGSTFRTIAGQFTNDFVNPGSVLFARLRLCQAGDQEIPTKKKEVLFVDGASAGANKPLPASVKPKDPHGLENRWCYVLAHALEQTSESVRTSLALDLGNRLRAAFSDRMTLAAHVAFIAAGAPHFSSLQSRIGLLGLVPSQKRPSVSAIAAALRRTEILDVARKRRGIDVARYPETNPAYYRMLHANLLADVGALDEAHEYCEYAKIYLTKRQGSQGKNITIKAQGEHVLNAAVAEDMDKKALAMFEDFNARLQSHGLKIGAASTSQLESSNKQKASSSLMGKFVGAIGETISETISQMTKEEGTSDPLSSTPPPAGSTGKSPPDPASAIRAPSQSLTPQDSAMKNVDPYPDGYKTVAPQKAAPSYPQFPAYNATAAANRHAGDMGNAVRSTLPTIPKKSEGQAPSDRLTSVDFSTETQGHAQASNLKSTGHATPSPKPPHHQNPPSLDKSYESFAKSMQQEGRRDEFLPRRRDENSQPLMEFEDGITGSHAPFGGQQALASDQSKTPSGNVAISASLSSPELHRIAPKPSDGPKYTQEDLGTPPVRGVSTPSKEKTKPPRPPASAPSGQKGQLDIKGSGTGRTGSANLEAKQSRMSRIISRLFYPGAKSVDWDEQTNKEQDFYFDKEREQYVFPNADGEVPDNPADKPPPTSLPPMNLSGDGDGGLHHSRSTPQMSNSNTANAKSSAESDPLAALVAPPPARIPKSSTMTRSKSEGEKLSGATGPPRYATFAPPPS